MQALNKIPSKTPTIIQCTSMSSAQDYLRTPYPSPHITHHTHIPQPIKIAAPTAHNVCSIDTIFIPAAFFAGPGTGLAVTQTVTIGGFDAEELVVVVANELEEEEGEDEADVDDDDDDDCVVGEGVEKEFE